MESYYLKTLLAFLQHQRTIGYEGIETVLDILEDNNQFPEDKKDAVLFVLHKWGLNEITHKGGIYQPAHLKTQKISKEIKELSHQTYGECFMGQMIGIQFLNGKILIEFGLN